MRDATNLEIRTASEILCEARNLQAGHGVALLSAVSRFLRGAAPSLTGARGTEQLVLH